jgi:GDP-fucose transporter C1
MSSNDGGKHSPLAIMGTVLFYLVAALAMVMANKWVLNSTEAPLFFLFTQLVIAVLLFLAGHAANLFIVPLHFDKQIVQGLVPTVSLNVVGLSFSNYTLKYVDASFYQVARGLVLPFTVCTSLFVLHSRPSLRILLACLLVTMGFFVGVFLDGAKVSVLGVTFGVVSSMITAVHSVVIKRSLDVVKGSALHLSWYTNLYSAIALIPVIFVAGEAPAITALFSETGSPTTGMSPLNTFLWGSAITGVFGFLMSIASLLSIKVTSPITHMVSSAVRGVAGSVLGVWLFNDVVTSGRASSIAIILGGSIYYTWVKHQETKSPQSPVTTKNGHQYDRLQMEDVESGKLSRTSSYSGKPE